jgi:hypothetical protein
MRPYEGKLPLDDGQWTMPAKDYGAYGYSQLDQINTSNAKDLKLAFAFSTGTLNGLEAAPLVVNNTMYIITSFPNLLYALELTKPGANGIPSIPGRTEAWGFSPLEDQQLGGLIMWVPSGLVFLGIGLWLFARWLQESERHVQLSTTANISRD